MRGDNLHLAVDVAMRLVCPVQLVLAHAKGKVVGRNTEIYVGLEHEDSSNYVELFGWIVSFYIFIIDSQKRRQIPNS